MDFEIAEGDHEKIRFLFERCLVACALYEDFWTKVGVRGALLEDCNVLIIWISPIYHANYFRRQVVYRKIPNISPKLIEVRTHFLGGLYSGSLYTGGLYTEGILC